MTDEDPAAEAGLGQPDRLGTWTEQQSEDYEAARHILTALVGAYAARIEANPGGAEAARLLAEQARYAAERRALAVTNDAAVARVLREYPALVRQIGDGGPLP